MSCHRTVMFNINSNKVFTFFTNDPFTSFRLKFQFLLSFYYCHSSTSYGTRTEELHILTRSHSISNVSSSYIPFLNTFIPIRFWRVAIPSCLWALLYKEKSWIAVRLERTGYYRKWQMSQYGLDTFIMKWYDETAKYRIRYFPKFFRMKRNNIVWMKKKE